jgi:anti-sigma regulatory factor (Ser/Thr protein kinase)
MNQIDDRLRLPPEPASAGAARRFVTEALKSCDIDVGLVVLLVSELVSNVVLHAHTPLAANSEDTSKWASVQASS